MTKKQMTRTSWRRRLTPAILVALPSLSLISLPAGANAKPIAVRSVAAAATAQPSNAEMAFANDVNELGDQTYPKVYAGDELMANGQTNIYIATGNSSALVSAIQSLSSSTNAPYTLVSAPRSYSALNALSSAVARHLSKLRAAGLQLSSWAGNPVTGKIDVSLATLNSRTTRAQANRTVAAIVSPAIDITATNAGPVTLLADRYHDTQPYFGGDNIQRTANNVTFGCTTGFEVFVGTTPVMLSAGHCGSGTWDNGTTSNEIGVTGQLHFKDGSKRDVQTIKNETYFQDVWSGAFGDPAVGVTVHGGFTGYVSVGQLITDDGSVTKEVRDVKVVASGDNVCVTSEGATICHLIKTNLNNQSGKQACQSGDSGGPVYQYAFGNGTQVKAAGLVEATDSSHCWATELASDLSETGSSLATG
jgi:hypothetical protein